MNELGPSMNQEVAPLLADLEMEAVPSRLLEFAAECFVERASAALVLCAADVTVGAPCGAGDEEEVAAGS